MNDNRAGLALVTMGAIVAAVTSGPLSLMLGASLGAVAAMLAGFTMIEHVAKRIGSPWRNDVERILEPRNDLTKKAWASCSVFGMVVAAGAALVWPAADAAILGMMATLYRSHRMMFGGDE